MRHLYLRAVMQSLWLILQLLVCLAIGFIFAKRLPHPLIQLCFKVLPWFSYLLLLSIAFEFAEIWQQLAQPMAIFQQSFLIALSTTLGAFVCCYAAFKWIGIQPTSGRVSFDLLLNSLKNILYALVALVLGYYVYVFTQYMSWHIQPDTWSLLLIFMLFIGIDLAFSPLDRSWLKANILLVPLGCIVGSVLAVCIYTYFSDALSFQDLLLLSQGYGFYSMSSIVISQLKDPTLGSIALMNDLFREIFAILLMYCVGWRYPRAAISAAGATAMDVSLPMVKQACGHDFIPHAMVSGFILSVLAPIAVSVLAAI